MQTSVLESMTTTAIITLSKNNRKFNSGTKSIRQVVWQWKCCHRSGRRESDSGDIWPKMANNWFTLGSDSYGLRFREFTTSPLTSIRPLWPKSSSDQRTFLRISSLRTDSRSSVTLKARSRRKVYRKESSSSGVRSVKSIWKRNQLTEELSEFLDIQSDLFNCKLHNWKIR